jgi:hypothetical protein
MGPTSWQAAADLPRFEVINPELRGRQQVSPTERAPDRAKKPEQSCRRLLRSRSAAAKIPRGNLGALSFPAEQGTPSIADLLQPVEEDHSSFIHPDGPPNPRLGVLNGFLAAHVDSQTRVG